MIFVSSPAVLNTPSTAASTPATVPPLEVPVRVQHELDRFGGELGDRGQDFGRERRELVVDHEHGVLADRNAEVPAFAGHHVYGVGELLGLDLDLGEVLLGRCGGGEEPRDANCKEAKKKGFHGSSPLAEL